MKQHRMVSWWFRPWFNWNPLDEKTKDILRRRADLMAENGADSAIVFGFHFRWDYMCFIDNVHAIIRFSAEELHKRGIQLWDHHSAVLAGRYNLHQDGSRLLSNPRQTLTGQSAGVPIYENLLDEWKMIDVTTGKPVFLPQYGAQEFCMNNPEFRAAYCGYLKRLIPETGVDGLMCDDAFFNPRFYVCSCPHCVKRFGKTLPPHTDLSFWGNYENEDFLEWIKMRHETVQDFNDMVAAQLPENFPLMNCCSGSTNASTNESALSIERYMHASNHAMLEMCGNTPDLNGTYTSRLSAQLHQLAATKAKKAPLFGLGYGFSETTANFIWAFNKFLGASTWFSQLTHRAKLDDETVQNFPEDASRVGTAFHAEEKFAEWFDSEHEGKAALLFSRNTMMNYGGYQVDYGADYTAACKMLFDGGWDFDVILSLEEAEKYPVLFLASCAMLTDSDRAALTRYKGKIYACGPLDGVEVPAIHREPLWPHDMWVPREPVPCKTQGTWREVRPGLFWHPAKAASGNVEFPSAETPVPAGWYRRTFRDAKGRQLTHYLAASFQVGLDEKLEALKIAEAKHFFINRLAPKPCEKRIAVPAGAEILLPIERKTVNTVAGIFEVPEKCWYFIVRK